MLLISSSLCLLFSGQLKSGFVQHGDRMRIVSVDLTGRGSLGLVRYGTVVRIHGLLDPLEVRTILVPGEREGALRSNRQMTVRTRSRRQMRVLLVCPTLLHQCVHFLWTCLWTFHAVPSRDKLVHLGSLHFLDTPRRNQTCE